MTQTVDPMSPQAVLDLWFADEHRPLWFRSTDAFDDIIREHFDESWQQARDGRFAHWESSPTGALALVILLDQFPLNMFRNDPRGFSTEAQSRQVADRAITRGFDQTLAQDQKPFLYLPFMHSEDLGDQDRSVALFEAAGLTSNLRWARHHREIVRRFGRFPHRNTILGRVSTAEELAWLETPDAFRG